MYIVKVATLYHIYGHILICFKNTIYYRLHVEIQIRLWRGALKSQRLGFIFSSREKITLLKFEISKLTKRKQKQLHCLKSLEVKILDIYMPPTV